MRNLKSRNQLMDYYISNKAQFLNSMHPRKTAVNWSEHCTAGSLKCDLKGLLT